jgi:hypothetical protein
MSELRYSAMGGTGLTVFEYSGVMNSLGVNQTSLAVEQVSDQQGCYGLRKWHNNTCEFFVDGNGPSLLGPEQRFFPDWLAF